MITRSYVRSLSDAEFAALKRRALVRLRGAPRTGTGDKQSYIAKARFARRYAQKLSKLRKKKWQPPNVKLQMLAYKFRKNPILDAFVPGREKKWIAPRKRKKHNQICLTHFSFLDHPRETLDGLRHIAECDASCADYQIHFDFDECTDIAPFVVLGIMRRTMTPAATGGRIKESIQRVLGSVQLLSFLGMRVGGATSSIDIWPLALREKPTGKSDAESQAFSGQSREKVTDDFVYAIDEWLHQIREGNQVVSLSAEGKGRIGKIFGELLDNAERHSIAGNERGGGWYVAGFMAKRQDEIGQQRLVCHLCIINTGRTIAESLAAAEDQSTRDKVQAYCDRHSGNFKGDASDLLRTVCSLQDRVSRTSQTGEGPHGGVGLMDMIEVVNILGQPSEGNPKPAITVLSGNSCLMLRDPYHQYFGGPPPTARVQWFNNRNSTDRAPDHSHVFTTEAPFPGTIVAIRFNLAEKFLRGSTPKDADDH